MSKRIRRAVTGAVLAGALVCGLTTTAGAEPSRPAPSPEKEAAVSGGGLCVDLEVNLIVHLLLSLSLGCDEHPGSLLSVTAVAD
jgi:hypothetical protein